MPNCCAFIFLPYQGFGPTGDNGRAKCIEENIQNKLIHGVGQGKRTERNKSFDSKFNSQDYIIQQAFEMKVMRKPCMEVPGA